MVKGELKINKGKLKITTFDKRFEWRKKENIKEAQLIKNFEERIKEIRKARSENTKKNGFREKKDIKNF